MDGLIKPLEKWKVLISGDHNKDKAAKINELENCVLKKKNYLDISKKLPYFLLKTNLLYLF